MQSMLDDNIISIISTDAQDALLPDRRRWRIEFTAQNHAIAHRRKYGTGGWIMGSYLYPGTGWTPTEVMLDCPDDGALL